MLEASNSDSIYNVSLFLDGLVDNHCALTKSAETVSAFTECIDMVNNLLSVKSFLSVVMLQYGISGQQLKLLKNM